jgi:type VI secretion system protein ImpA
MAELDRFLDPIAGGESPAGKYLKYTPLYPELEEARRREDPAVVAKLNLGREAKAADFKRVVKLAEDALINKSKDLQIAVWLTEAWIHRDGMAGLVSGIQLIQSLLERYWDTLYPEIEDGDTGMRSMPLNWLGSSFDVAFAVRSIPLTAGRGLNTLDYQTSRQIGYESDVRGNAARLKARNEAIKDGKVPPEDFDKDFDSTPKTFYKELVAGCAAARECIAALDQFCGEKFADDPPSFSPLSKALEEVNGTANSLLARKLEQDPDPVETPADELGHQEEAGAPENHAAEAVLRAAPVLNGQIGSLDEAAAHVIAAAEFLRRKSPANPVPYLLVRALRWGELRSAQNLTDLPAPSADVRTALRAAASAKNWPRVLEAAEAAMSSPSGRGWLDAHRYTIVACDQLGYSAAAKALRGELKALLTEFPQLPSSVLSDDTGAANPETLAWLKQEGLIA